MIYYCFGSVIVVEKTEEVKRQLVSSDHKGPMEGMVIVDGHPRMESSDMPTISFTEAGLQRLIDHYKKK